MNAIKKLKAYQLEKTNLNRNQMNSLYGGEEKKCGCVCAGNTDADVSWESDRKKTNENDDDMDFWG